jgi:glycine cleavage system T protein (aminomethyltransferase)
LTRISPFNQITADRAAGYQEEVGWLWVTNYGDVDAEYRAVREAVGMLDVAPLNKWELRGPDALEAAQRVHTADVMGMQVGQVRYGAFVDEDGMLVDDGTVYRFPDGLVWLMTNDDRRAKYLADATKGLDVEIREISLELPNVQVQGPGSRDLLRGIARFDIDAMGYYRFTPEQVEVGGVAAWVSRTGFSGELGYEVFCRPVDAVRLWEVIEGAGAIPYGVDVVETLRVEVGMIVTDYDYTPHERSPFDVGLDAFVALDADGEFMGKDRLLALAKEPPNRFMTLRLGGDRLPKYGATVRRGGDEVGELTSPAASPRYGHIGLAIIRTDAAGVGERVEVDVADGTVEATVDVLAIHDPNKRRPRA